MPIEIWPLPIFPEGALASSVITCVWVGVAVSAFFNLRFGWSLSGIVVPGYLVPLLISRPFAVLAVYIEAVFAYGLVYFLSERLSRAGLWASFFGRDRFFALILASVAMRLLFDLGVFPLIGTFVGDTWGIRIDTRNELHSFGLVVVALTANQLWKPGAVRGSACFAITLAFTYLIIRFGLMEATNFSISNLRYVYEDVAGSIQAAPKAYIILVSTCFVSSRLNLRYGWDFNGILVPSLLALQWYQPSVILTSVLEALAILALSILLMRVRWIANLNIEGARKLVLFFNVGFLYKIVVAHGLALVAPNVDPTDAYGYGYLLSTLMALKMHEREIPIRLTRSTLQASLTAIVMATILGLLLASLPAFRLGGPDYDATRARPIEDSELSLADWLSQDRTRLYRPDERNPVPSPMPGEILDFTRGIGHLIDGSPKALSRAAQDLARANYQVLRTSDGIFYLRELEPIRGWGLFAIDPEAGSDLLVEAPAPLDERGTFDAAIQLFERLDAHALAIAGSRRDVLGSPAADVLRSQNTLFQAFHLERSKANTLQVRRRRVPKKSRRSSPSVAAEAGSSQLYVTERLPDALPLRGLEELLGELTIHWDRRGGENRQREARHGGFSELLLSPESIRQLLVRRGKSVPGSPSAPMVFRREAPLDLWLGEAKAGIARAGTNAYEPPRDEDLVYLDEEILTPLLAWAIDPIDATAARSEAAASAGDARSLAKGEPSHPLDPIASAARSIGYRLSLLRDPTSSARYVVLDESPNGPRRRHWGSVVFRVGTAAPFTIQVPRPLSDRDSLESGAALFERLRARALIGSGAHLRANDDGSSVLLASSNAHHLVNLATQVVVRESRSRPGLVVQMAGLSTARERDGKAADAYLALADWGPGEAVASLPVRHLQSALEADGMRVALVDGSAETAGHEVGSQALSRYSTLWPERRFAILWLSRNTRESLAPSDRSRLEASRFQALEIPTITGALAQTLAERSWLPASGFWSADLGQTLARYLDTRDIVALEAFQHAVSPRRITRFVDVGSRQSFLLVRDAAGRILGVANLTPRDPGSRSIVDPDRIERIAIERFVERRDAWLLGEEGA